MDRHVGLKKEKKKKMQKELYVTELYELYAVGHISVPLDSYLRTDDLRKDCVGGNSITRPLSSARTKR